MLVSSEVFPASSGGTKSSTIHTLVLRYGPRHVLVLLPKSFQVGAILWDIFRSFRLSLGTTINHACSFWSRARFKLCLRNQRPQHLSGRLG